MPEEIEGRSQTTGLSHSDMTEIAATDAEGGALRELARTMQLRIETLVQAAWALVLGEYTGSENVGFDATVAGHPADLARADVMAAPLVSTCPVRVPMPGEVSVVEWLRQMERDEVDARTTEYAPPVQGWSWSELPRGTEPFDSVVRFENALPDEYSVVDQNNLGAGSPIEACSSRQGKTSYTRSLDIELGERIRVALCFDKGRITSAAARQVLACLKSALSLIAEGWNEPLSRLKQSLSMMRREHAADQQKDFLRAQRTQISNLRRRA